MFETLEMKAIIEKIPMTETILSIALLVVRIIASKITKRLLKRRADAPVDEDSFISRFLHEERKFLLKSISILFWLIFLAGLIYVWSPHLEKIFNAVQGFYMPIARTIIIVIIAFLAYKAAQLFAGFIIERVTPFAERGTARGRQRVQTLSHVFRYGSTILIVVLTTLMLLSTFGIDLKAILATVGVASLAIGFGAQSLVKDIIGGIFILCEDQYGVGDVVIINGEGGYVEKMTLRITQMRNPHGTLITVPNGAISNVKNLTSEWSRIDFKIGVAYDTDLDHAVDVLMDEANKLMTDMPGDITEEPERLGVDEFGDSAITIRTWIKTKPLRQWAVQRELNRRIHKRFAAEGIEIPFPQRTLWIKEPKEELLAKLAEKVK